MLNILREAGSYTVVSSSGTRCATRLHNAVNTHLPGQDFSFEIEFRACVYSTVIGDFNSSTGLVPCHSERGKIFHVHFRNVKGGLHNFVEVWPDEGDVRRATVSLAGCCAPIA